MEGTVTNFIYLICISLFIIGLKKLSHPDSARTGNLLAAAGMIGALLVTLFTPLPTGDNNYGVIAGGIAIGSVIGLVAAKRIKMTAMPEMVSLFNGLGGACAMLLAIVEFYNHPAGETLLSGQIATTFFALFIGSISFTGSLVAYGKLDGFLRDSLVPPAPKVVNVLLADCYSGTLHLYHEPASAQLNLCGGYPGA